MKILIENLMSEDSNDIDPHEKFILNLRITLY